MKQITGDTGVIATGTATVSTFVRTRAVRPPTLGKRAKRVRGREGGRRGEG